MATWQNGDVLSMHGRDRIQEGGMTYDIGFDRGLAMGKQTAYDAAARWLDEDINAGRDLDILIDTLQSLAQGYATEVKRLYEQPANDTTQS